MSKSPLPENYAVFDVETPNQRNDSICSIGIIHVADSIIVNSHEYLVNPEASFGQRNIDIHHIIPSMIKDAPLFPVVWNQIEHYFTNGIVVAHNAHFDLTVLAKTLQRYDIPVPDMYYICTCTLARKHIAKEAYGCHKLNALCDGMGITLERHHNALCDALACKALLERLSNDYGITDDDIKGYRYEPEPYSASINHSIVEKAMNTLYGILYGIGCDKRVSPDEYTSIFDWMQEYEEYKGYSSFSDSYDILSEVLQDSYISLEEYEQLMSHITMHTSSTVYNDVTLSLQVMMGIIQGISGDGKVNETEATELRNWMTWHETLKGNYPYDKVFMALENVLADGILSKEEEQSLLTLFKYCTHPEAGDSCSSVDLNGKCCCLSGNFTHGSKAEVEAFIRSKGGTCADNLTKAVHYLIVGVMKSEAWAYGNYGTKVKKAREMQAKGSDIVILEEDKLYMDC